jgi:2,3-bisphosphoglycerate-dependent phosphoglycerate mutase
VPLSYTWRLNERHYGALTGRNKRDCSQEYGLAQVQRWRRSVNEPPPPMDAGAAAALLDERAYRDVPKPLAESLDQCAERLRPFLEVELTAAMRKAVDECGFVAEQDGLPVEVPTFVVSASENVLRALVRELEGLSDDETPLIDVPHATPLVYRLDSALRPLPSALAKSPLRKGWYMADPERIAASQKSIREEVDCRLNDVPCKVDEEDEETCFVNSAASTEWACGL